MPLNSAEKRLRAFEIFMIGLSFLMILAASVGFVVQLALRKIDESDIGPIGVAVFQVIVTFYSDVYLALIVEYDPIIDENCMLAFPTKFGQPQRPISWDECWAWIVPIGSFIVSLACWLYTIYFPFFAHNHEWHVPFLLVLGFWSLLHLVLKSVYKHNQAIIWTLCNGIILRPIVIISRMKQASHVFKWFLGTQEPDWFRGSLMITCDDNLSCGRNHSLSPFATLVQELKGRDHSNAFPRSGLVAASPGEACRLYEILVKSGYDNVLLAKPIDEYASLQTKAAESNEETADRKEALDEKLDDKYLTDGQYKQAIEMAIRCRRLDKLKEAISSNGISGHATLSYCMNVSHAFDNNREYRHEILEAHGYDSADFIYPPALVKCGQILRLLVEVYQGLESPDHLNSCKCLMFLDEPDTVAGILEKLLRSENKDDAMMSFQIAFDLIDSEHQAFLLTVRNRLSSSKLQPAQPATAETESVQSGNRSASEDTRMTNEILATNAGVWPETDPSAVTYAERLTKIKGILSGNTSTELTAQFLCNHHIFLKHPKLNYRSESDVLILKTMKQFVKIGNRVCHSMAMCAYAIMNAGTAIDTFPKGTPDCLSWATNWGKFSAIAGLGVIYGGRLKKGRYLMAPYLSQSGSGGGGGGGGNPYLEGGALYALGLIHANHGEGIKEFLCDTLRSSNVDVVQHGSCLGLGLAALGTADEDVYDTIKNALTTSSAVAGEAAGISMGLVMVGASTEKKAGEMLACAQELEDGKIKRALALGIALSLYGKEEEADTVIEQMTQDQDPILRYGGMYALALAYRGTANKKAILRLLHFAVSDVSDDVKRTAALALGFLLYSKPEQFFRTPETVSLLSTAYNPHVRYGAALAVGISCAGTGLSEAISSLEPLTSDDVEFVRQGALIAKALVMVQMSEDSDTRVGGFRQQLGKITRDEHEDTMTKTAATLASGILVAGGGNVTIRLLSKTKRDRISAVVGLAVFSHSWCSYPLMLFISLSLSPTALVGLNYNLEVPKFDILLHAKPYPETLHKPARVVPAQEKFIRFRKDSRYVPVDKEATSGFVLFKDLHQTRPGNFGSNRIRPIFARN